MLYSTYFGSAAGNNAVTDPNTTEIEGIGIDSSNDIFISGQTTATDIPTTSAAYQTSCPVGVDTNIPCWSAFLSELNPGDQNQLLYSTYFSGTTDTTLSSMGDIAPSSGAGNLALDLKGKVYIAGSETESDFPTTKGVLNAGPCEAQQCSFVAKFDTTQSSSSSLVYSTLFGGTTGLTEMGAQALWSIAMATPTRAARPSRRTFPRKMRIRALDRTAPTIVAWLS